MGTLLRWVFLLVVLGVFAPAVQQVEAQDTLTATVIAAQDGGQPPTVVVEDQASFDPVWVIVGVVAGALIGVPIGLGGGVLLLRRLNDSMPFKDALEHLAMSVPRESFQEVIQEIHQGAQGVQDIFKFFMTQYAYPNLPAATAAVLRQGAELGYQASTLVEAVTDGEPNLPAAG